MELKRGLTKSGERTLSPPLGINLPVQVKALAKGTPLGRWVHCK